MAINQLVFYRISANYQYKTDSDLKLLEESEEDDFTIATTVSNPI